MAEGGQLGKYQIVEELGAGGFATVFKAVDTTLDREVALKILHPPLLADRRFVHNFRQEAKTLAALRHPQIITIYEVGEVDGRIFIAMELARGISLAKAIASRKRIPWSETLALLGPVCAALDYAHEQNVVHRDLKPANILIDKHRGSLLTDFGFAKLLAENSASLSMSGGIVGTPCYIAPEVWENNSADAPVDIYALGCIVYEMRSGDVLFKGQTPMQAMRAHDRGPQFAETWPEDMPAGITNVLRKALAREPSERYASAGALWQALNDLEQQAQAARAAAEQAEAAKRETERRAAEVEREAAQRTAIAAEWRAEAERAIDAKEWEVARMAIGRWRAVTPEDLAIRDVQAKLEHLIATRQLETELRSPAQRKPVAQEQVLGDLPKKTISPATASPVASKQSTVTPPIRNTTESLTPRVAQGGGWVKIIGGVVGLAIVVFLGVILITNYRSTGSTGALPTTFVTATISAATAASVPVTAPGTTAAAVTTEPEPTPEPDIVVKFDTFKNRTPIHGDAFVDRGALFCFYHLGGIVTALPQGEPDCSPRGGFTALQQDSLFVYPPKQDGNGPNAALSSDYTACTIYSTSGCTVPSDLGPVSRSIAVINFPQRSVTSVTVHFWLPPDPYNLGIGATYYLTAYDGEGNKIASSNTNALTVPSIYPLTVQSSSPRIQQVQLNMATKRNNIPIFIISITTRSSP